jgi:dihydrolipoamide dehydrogenase
MKTYDIIVIGGGGGLKVALSAAGMGMKTAMIEQEAVGGTCLNRGCIPSKMLIYPTTLPRIVREARRINVSFPSKASVRFKSLIRRISATVDAISDTQRKKIKHTPNLDFYPSHGEFIAGRVLRVGKAEITARKVFIATGSRPQIPDIDGLRETPFMTSREALRRTKLPGRLLVIGGGLIAVELGGAYGAAGAKVEFIVRNRFLRNEDAEIAKAFSDIFGGFHTVHQEFTPVRVDYDAGLFAVTCKNKLGRAKVFSGDALLVAAGVKPCTDALGLENTKIRTDEKGFVLVNDRLQTDVRGVYALGDCVGNYFFRHTVNYEAQYLVRTVLKGAKEGAIDYGPVPHAVFGVPEIAAVGMTEQQAADEGRDYCVGKASYADSNAGLARGYQYGFVKILVDRATRQILGAHILGDQASDMIHLFVVLMKKEGTLDDLLDMIWVHPALPEVARDAARDAERQMRKRIINK